MPLRVVTIALVGGGTKSLWIPVGGIRGRIEGAVREYHWIINQKWLFPVLVDEVADKVCTDLWPVFAVDVVLFLTVDLQQRIDETSIDILITLGGSTATRMLPEAGLLKTKVLR